MQIRRTMRLAAWFALATASWASPSWSQGPAPRPGASDAQDESLDWTADANIGALSLEHTDMRATGDLTLGIGSDSFGVVAWGSGSYSDFETQQLLDDTQKLEGAADAWAYFGDAAAPVRLTVRASGGGANYDSTWQDKTVAGHFADQTSWMGRGSILLGADLRPSDAFSAYLAAGAGLQYEWYDAITPGPGGTVEAVDNQDLSLLGNARLDASWIAARDVVSVRLRVLATYFRLTRNEEYLSSDAGAVDVTITTFEQLDATARAFLDIDAASVLGFRPTVHAGLNHVRISGESETQSTTYPVFGAGVLRPWM